MRTVLISPTSTRKRWKGDGGSTPPCSSAEAAAKRRITSAPVSSTARPDSLASPSLSSGSTGAECSARRGSASRSRALTERCIIPSQSCPARKVASLPERRGEPSARKVASTLFVWASKAARTAAARSGTAASTSPQVAMSPGAPAAGQRSQCLGQAGHRPQRALLAEAPDAQRRVGPLHRLRLAAGGGQSVVLPGVVRRLVAEQGEDDLAGLVEAVETLPQRRQLDAVGGALLLV